MPKYPLSLTMITREATRLAYVALRGAPADLVMLRNVKFLVPRAAFDISLDDFSEKFLIPAISEMIYFYTEACQNWPSEEPLIKDYICTLEGALWKEWATKEVVTLIFGIRRPL
jgi:hypothetical protein